VTIPPNEPPQDGGQSYLPPSPSGQFGTPQQPQFGGQPNNPQTPPAGAYYNAPPPQKSGGSGCLKAAGITCLVLVVLGVIGAIVAINAVKNAASNPHSIFGQVGAAISAAKGGAEIQQAIVKYHTNNGKYPDKLGQLVPQYLPLATLHSDTDADPNPAHVSWTYKKPSEGAPPKTPILSLPLKFEVPGQNGTNTEQSTPIIINLDGTSASGQASTSSSTGSSGSF
jgi:hypothetical protein